MTLSQRQFPKITIPTVCVACLDTEREEDILDALHACEKEHGLIVWSINEQSTPARWTLAFETKVNRECSNGRIENASRLVIVGNPHSEQQAKTINRVCPGAHLLYIGGQPEQSHQDPCKRGIIQGVNTLIKRHHPHQVLEPNTLIDIIIKHIVRTSAAIPVHSMLKYEANSHPTDMILSPK